MNIKKYIESGVLESYVLGSASEDETRTLLQLKKQYPEIREALFNLELDVEHLARRVSVPPPPGMLSRIEESINQPVLNTRAPAGFNQTQNNYQQQGANKTSQQFIEIMAETNHVRIHKGWRWVFGGVFILSKIFLVGFIYYYLSNKQANAKVDELKAEIEQLKQNKLPAGN